LPLGHFDLVGALLPQHAADRVDLALAHVNAEQDVAVVHAILPLGRPRF
jgi:hypothetical protein